MVLQSFSTASHGSTVDLYYLEDLFMILTSFGKAVLMETAVSGYSSPVHSSLSLASPSHWYEEMCPELYSSICQNLHIAFCVKPRFLTCFLNQQWPVRSPTINLTVLLLLFSRSAVNLGSCSNSPELSPSTISWWFRLLFLSWFHAMV